MGTGAGRWRFGHDLLLRREIEGEGEMDKGGDPGEGEGRGWIEEAVVADLHEAFGQDMLEEPADELEGTESHGSPSVAVGLLVAVEYGIVFHLQDSAVGDGDAEDIGGEVLDGVRAISHGLGVDDPGHVPDLGADLAQEPCLFHFIPELDSEEGGEGFNREEEVEV